MKPGRVIACLLASVSLIATAASIAQEPVREFQPFHAVGTVFFTETPPECQQQGSPQPRILHVAGSLDGDVIRRGTYSLCFGDQAPPTPSISTMQVITQDGSLLRFEVSVVRQTSTTAFLYLGTFSLVPGGSTGRLTDRLVTGSGTLEFGWPNGSGGLNGPGTIVFDGALIVR